MTGFGSLASLVLGACLLTSCGKQPAAEDLEPRSSEGTTFTFLNLTAGDTTLDEARRDNLVENCVLSPNGGDTSTICKITAAPPNQFSTDISPLVRTEINAAFSNGKFSGISTDFFSVDADSVSLRLKDLYGAPCKVLPYEDPALFDFAVQEWCFTNGRLIFSRKMGETAAERKRAQVKFELADPS
ncbi:hypothetical protein M2336_002793 [Sphingobium sp. B1D7B]|uniref:hypothetical protein n=1 Tax=Sphingobium sp. B1D7B TaxID=2940578 RepID=UPI002224AD1E|nr:hypothetical protein [Sphingobium sp. B1D7B]MCW2406164.1 hypothetical protein [Sphingobium sp. B1D7B]